MSNPRSCKKCGHLHLQATHGELEACPECGAIYSRVEAAIKEGKAAAFTPQAPKPKPIPVAQPEPPPQAAAPAAPAPIKPFEPVIAQRPYIEELREQSNYPTFRSFVGFCTGFGYLIAGLVAVAALLSLPTNNSSAGGIGIALAILIFILTKFGKEAALMLADLSDAAAIIAENSKPKTP